MLKNWFLLTKNFTKKLFVPPSYSGVAECSNLARPKNTNEIIRTSRFCLDLNSCLLNFRSSLSWLMSFLSPYLHIQSYIDYFKQNLRSNVPTSVFIDNFRKSNVFSRFGSRIIRNRRAHYLDFRESHKSLRS